MAVGGTLEGGAGLACALPGSVRDRVRPRYSVGEPAERAQSADGACDGHDVVRAYSLALERGADGAVYNVSSGAALRIRDLLSRLLAMAGAAGTPVVEDPALWRPADEVPTLSTARLRADTGWEPEIPIDRTLRDLLAGA